MRIVITGKARDDLNEIYFYLKPLNPGAAYNQVAAIDEKFAQLARFPFIGRERSAFGVGVRSVVSGTKVIFYVVEPDRVVILRILDGRTDLDEEFKR